MTNNFEQKPLWAKAPSGRVINIPILGVCGEFGSGKTLFGINIAPGNHPEGHPFAGKPRTGIIDAEMSSTTYEGSALAFERFDLPAMLMQNRAGGFTPIELYEKCRSLIDSIPNGRYDALIIDPVTDIDSGLTDYVKANCSKFGLSSRQLEKSSGLLWGVVKDQWNNWLLQIAQKCKTFVFMAHMRDHYIGNIPSGKREPKGKETLGKLASLYLELSRKPGKDGKVPAAPTARIIKGRLCDMILDAGGEIQNVELLPPIFENCTPQRAIIATLTDGTTIKGEAQPGDLTPGILYRFDGYWTTHPKYGRQFQFVTFCQPEPKDRASIENYLATCPGIGTVRARKIVDKMGLDCIRIIKETLYTKDWKEPVIRGVTDNVWRDIYCSLKDRESKEGFTIEMKKLLGGKGFPKKIFAQLEADFGTTAPEMIRENPFLLLKYKGVGFERADQVYHDLGKDVRDFLNEGHSYDELLKLAENAERIEGKTKLKSALTIELGQIEPCSGKIVLDPNRTLPTAEAFIAQKYTLDGVRTLHYQNGTFFHWEKNAYRAVEGTLLQGQMLRFLSDAIVQRVCMTEVMFDPFPAKAVNVEAALSAVEGLTFRSKNEPTPAWLDENTAPICEPSEIIFGRTKNLTINYRTEIPASPKWFNFNALDFEYDEAKSYAPKWDIFMSELFGSDIESYAALMEYIGLLLTPITKFQKALLLVGPKRSGKGTIARIVQKLVGHLNCCGPTTDSLTQDFGLQPLIGKTVAFINGARFRGKNLPTLIERLLNITGEDNLIVNRKNKEAISMRLQTRFFIISNEVPSLHDASGAIASRFVVIKLKNSFYGKENLGLENELSEELPGILHLALWSLQNLLNRGHFLQPESAREEIELMEDLGSPIGRFVREKCNLGAACWIASEELWDS